MWGNGSIIERVRCSSATAATRAVEVDRIVKYSTQTSVFVLSCLHEEHIVQDRYQEALAQDYVNDGNASK